MLNYCLIFSYYLVGVSVVMFGLGVKFIVGDVGYYFDWVLMFILSSEIHFSLVVDSMSMLFGSFVCFISGCVFFYSVDYMSSDKSVNRFGLLVFLFVLSMLLVIFSSSLVGLLLGWDGLGLVSYCLVIYYQNLRSYNAGMITILSNRIGDAALLLSISWLMIDSDWFYLYYYDYQVSDLKWIVILVLLAAFTKSAQIPFSAWLPAAMAAPTPVSALVHSSTLVTAGVYLIIRFGSYTEDFNFLYSVLCLMSLLTMFMAGLGANWEYDLKSIIALSTLSQLGLMMFVLSFGAIMFGFFHLLTHAMFKALLFLCAGSYIHVMGDNQDIRKMGGLINGMVYVSSVLGIASLALLGFPFMAGFYSKDVIVECYLMGGINMFVVLFLMVSVGLTACYSIRLGYYVLWKGVNYRAGVINVDCGFQMMLPMFLLLFMAVISGSILSWLMFPIPYGFYLGDIKLVTFIMMVVGLIVGYLVSWGEYISLNLLGDFLGSMWFMSMLSGQYVSEFFVVVGDKIFKFGDVGWLSYLGGGGVYGELMSGSSYNQIIQGSSFKIFMGGFAIWIVILVLI